AVDLRALGKRVVGREARHVEEDEREIAVDEVEIRARESALDLRVDVAGGRWLDRGLRIDVGVAEVLLEEAELGREQPREAAAVARLRERDERKIRVISIE